MKKLFLLSFLIVSSLRSHSQTVTGIAADYHDGQVFITWNNIAGADTGFYYVYKNSVPITSANFQSSAYLGKVQYNSSYDFRYTTIFQPNNLKYFITDDDPLTTLTATQGFFVMNCIVAGMKDYFAVRCNYGKTSANWQLTVGSNATSTSVTEHLHAIKPYLLDKITGLVASDTMLVYVHYGSNVSANGYPALCNEGCLPFHFGLVRSGPVGGNNALYAKFHGGGGDFVNNSITNDFTNSWKVTFDDWIPAFKNEPLGDNTRWLGYSDKLDIYKYDKNTPPPTSGTIKCYTYYRINWELGWMQRNWPNTIDTTKIYLSGSSQGCSGVFTHCLIDPSKFAAGESTDGKFNMNAPDDANPECKFNEGKSGRRDARILWGNEDSVNLKTDILLPNNSTNYYKIYDLTNMNYMFEKQQNVSLPFIYALNGKNDDNTCWEEKVIAYNSIQLYNSGGIYYWDLRGHGGGINNAWNSFKLEEVERFATNKSYPAFSNSEIDGNPGSPTNPEFPYFSGDDIGTLHGNLNWDPVSVKDSALSWSVYSWIFSDTLKDGSLFPGSLPKFAKTDITINRPQFFKGFAKKQKLYWFNIYNGDTVQHGSITQRYAGAVPKRLTVKGVKIYPGGGTFRIQTTNAFPRLMPQEVLRDNKLTAYPNPFNDYLQVKIELVQEGNIIIRVINLLGEEMLRENLTNAAEGENFLLLNTASLHGGIYILQVQTPESRWEIMVEKN